MHVSGWFALTLRIHRAEVVLLTMCVLVACAAVVAATIHIESVAPSDACWATLYPPDGSPDPSRACIEAYRSFNETQHTTMLAIMAVIGPAPWLVGLVLGVSIVGRELETGTAGLAWSLSGRRLRWLATRAVPLVALGIGLLLVLAAVSRILWDAAFPWSELGPGRLPSLVALGFEGPTIVAGGIAALGLGLLLGTVAGRTMPALAIGAVLALGLALALGPVLQTVLAQHVAAWAPRDDSQADAERLIDLDVGYRDGDGPILGYEEAEALAEAHCPTCADEDIDWVDENLESWRRSAPLTSYPVFEGTQVGAELLIGLLCTAGAVPIVARRRPTA